MKREKVNPRLMLGRDWEGDNPSGWYWGEKLEGVHCEWDGKHAWSKEDNEIKLPPHILDALPTTPLVGEIYAGRGNFEIARSAVQYGQWNKSIRFVVFDKPDAKGNIWQRLQVARLFWKDCITVQVCKSYAELMDALRFIQSERGEGLMIHSPLQTRYEPGRTSRLLKVKLVLPLLT
jgi:DNA ligase-1